MARSDDREYFRAQLGAIVAGALSFEERKTLPIHLFVEGPSVGQWEQLWNAVTTDGNRDAFANLLSDRNIGQGERIRMLGIVQGVPPTAFPFWVAELQDFLQSSSDTKDRMFEDLSIGTIPDIAAPFVPFVATAYANLLEKHPQSLSAFSQSARRQVAEQLTSRLFAVSRQVLNSPLSAGDVIRSPPLRKAATIREAYLSTSDASAEEWLAVWAAYPALARAMAIVVSHWKLFVRTLSTRLLTDFDELSNVFGEGPLGKVQHYRFDLGDIHCHGAAVCCLEFDSGCTIVYKPRPGDPSILLSRLVEVLKEPDFQVCVPQSLLRCGYAWHQFVDGDDGAAVDRGLYYRRVGYLACLLRLLNAVDLHRENVICNQNSPVIVDAETCASPFPPFSSEVSDEGRCKWGEYLDSVFTSGLVTMKLSPGPGTRAKEMAGMTAVNAGSYPNAESAFSTFGFGEELVEGYLRLANRLSAAPEVRGYIESTCVALGNSWIRYVFRPTMIYEELLNHSLSAESMRDGRGRSIALERLWNTYSGTVGHRKIIEAEILALGRCDFPLCATTLASRAVILDDGSVVEDFFSKSAIGLTAERLDAMEAATPDRQQDDICTAIAVYDIRAGVRDIKRSPSGRTIKINGLCDAMADLMCSLKAAVTRDRNGLTVIRGIYYEPTQDICTFGRLPNDLFSGIAGIAVVLNDVEMISGDFGARQLARELVLGAIGTSTPEPTEIGSFWFSERRAWRYLLERWITPNSEETNAINKHLRAMGRVESSKTPIPDSEFVKVLPYRSGRSNHGVKERVFSTFEGRFGITSGRLLGLLASYDRGEIGRSAIAPFLSNLFLIDPESPTDAMEAAEVAITAAQSLGDERFHERSLSLVHLMTTWRNWNDRWLADRVAPERHLLSCIFGLTAILHIIARINNPVRCCSIRLAGNL